MGQPTNQNTVDEIIRLYTEERLSAKSVSTRTGVSENVVYRYLKLKGVTRSHSEAHSVPTYQRNKIGRRYGTSGWWQSSKTGRWEPADSKLEMVRMSQLDADPLVKTWHREATRIPLPGGRNYTPDFTIQMTDGKLIVEEVKAKGMLHHGKNDLKQECAAAFFLGTGVEFRIVTEDEIGREEIKSFCVDGLLSLPQAEKVERRKQRNRELASLGRIMHPDRKKEYENANKARLIEYRKQYRDKNTDAIKKRHRATFDKIRAEHPEQYLEQLVKTNIRRNAKYATIKEIAATLVLSGIFERKFGKAEIKRNQTRAETNARYKAKKQARSFQPPGLDTTGGTRP